MTKEKIDEFKETVITFYRNHGRHSLPWRMTSDPYKIVVSEIMLQQTQVDRVIPKFSEFISLFPSFKSLAEAQTQRVIKAWKGLGYNSRAVRLQQTAKKIIHDYNGELPQEEDLLLTLPGIGPATAGDLRAFIWNIPSVVIETNIRTVIIHHFFPNHQLVTEEMIRETVGKTINNENPREWYWALMDYGSFLKSQGNSSHRKANIYRKQSSFNGSNRQLRSYILEALVKDSPQNIHDIYTYAMLSADRDKRELPTQKDIANNITSMEKDGLVTAQNDIVSLN